MDNDLGLSTIKGDLEADQLLKGLHTLINEILFYKHHVVLPRSSNWTGLLIEEFQFTPTGGHSGAFRTC